MKEYKLFYKSKSGVLADVIPFFEEDRFYLFYLHDYRNVEEYGQGTPWYLISSRDFVEFEEYGEVISRGSKSDQDLYIFTGSCIKINDLYHIFYTGHNPHFKELGKPVQAVMHATSHDLIKWDKKPDDTFYAEEGYEVDDWRDPFVIFNEDKNEYWMLLATRKKNGNKIRSGSTALLTSKDCKKWSINKDLWYPKRFFTHECPDLFKLGDWWYLVYSEFTDRCQTRYRMSKSIDGPWLLPENDTFDGRAFYAAKTAAHKTKRYIFGWNPTRKDSIDSSRWSWGGNLVVHELYQIDNGELRTRGPEKVLSYYDKTIFAIDKMIVDGTNTTRDIVFNVALPDCYMVEMDIEFDSKTSECGLLVRNDQLNDRTYYYSLNPSRRRFSFDVLPNHPWNTSNFINVERFGDICSNKKHKLQVIVENDICVAYLNESLALSSRMYENEGKPLGFISYDGITQISNIKIKVR